MQATTSLLKHDLVPILVREYCRPKGNLENKFINHTLYLHRGTGQMVVFCRVQA